MRDAGAIADPDSAAADEHGTAMAPAGVRHFRHRATRANAQPGKTGLAPGHRLFMRDARPRHAPT
jgi:hypothetical protein